MEIILFFANFWDSLPKVYQTSFIVMFVFFLTYMIRGGVTNRVIIYFDFSDYVINLVMIICLIFTILIWLNPEPFHSKILNFLYLYVLATGITGVALVLFAISSIITYQHNRNIPLGIMVNVFKFIYALLSIVGSVFILLLTIASLFNAIDKAKNHEYVDAAGHTVGVFVGLGAIGFIIQFTLFSLINGEKVYEKKGLFITK